MVSRRVCIDMDWYLEVFSPEGFCLIGERYESSLCLLSSLCNFLLRMPNYAYHISRVDKVKDVSE